MLNLFLLFMATIVACLLFTASLTFHELGHAAAARLLRLPVIGASAGSGPWLLHLPLRWPAPLIVRLLPTHGATSLARPLHEEPALTRVLVALAGPAASVAVAGLCAGVAALVGSGSVGSVAHTMALANLALAAFNLAPVPPLDGWQAVEPSLERVGLRLTPARRAGLYAGGWVAITVATVAFFAARWWG